jgi:hypothetical protein
MGEKTMSLLFNSVTDKWTSGNIEINQFSIKFPTSVLQLSNVSYVGAQSISLKEYILSFIFFALFIIVSFNIPSKPQSIYGNITNGPSPAALIFVSILLLVLAVLTFPRHRHYLLIMANSGSSQLITGKKEFIYRALWEIVKYIEQKNTSYSSTINISDAKIIGDVVGGRKTEFKNA